MKYNYFENVKEDTIEAIKDNYTMEEIKEKIEDDKQRFIEELEEMLWTDDSVTGNGSGSYTFNTYQAEENLSHNLDLLEEVAEEYGIEPTIKAGWEHGAEWWDCTIRCYYLRQAIEEALAELEDEIEEN